VSRTRLLLIRRQRPLGEPPDPDAGGRRMLDALARAGVDLAGPGWERTTWPLPAAAAHVDLGRGPGGTFDAVVVGSHLVNAPDEMYRTAVLRAAVRHLEPGGRLLVEHHPLDWLETAAESWSEGDGRRLGMVDVVVQPPFVSAVSVYEAGGETLRQPFTARVLSEDELGAALGEAGLTVRRRLSPTWLEAQSRVAAVE
jgi:hypothetical protein